MKYSGDYRKEGFAEGKGKHWLSTSMCQVPCSEFRFVISLIVRPTPKFRQYFSHYYRHGNQGSEWLNNFPKTTDLRFKQEYDFKGWVFLPHHQGPSRQRDDTFREENIDSGGCQGLCLHCGCQARDLGQLTWKALDRDQNSSPDLWMLGK